MNQKGFLSVTLIVIVVLVAVIGGYLVIVKKSEPTMQVNPHPLREGDEISVRGNYIKNTSDGDSGTGVVDGGTYQIINTEQYGQIQIVIGGFRTNCLAKEIYQASRGELIEVYGKVISDPSSKFFNGNRLSVCSSDRYYIRKN